MQRITYHSGISLLTPLVEFGYLRKHQNERFFFFPFFVVVIVVLLTFTTYLHTWYISYISLYNHIGKPLTI